jgi:hypothetical protein
MYSFIFSPEQSRKIAVNWQIVFSIRLSDSIMTRLFEEIPYFFLNFLKSLRYLRVSTRLETAVWISPERKNEKFDKVSISKWTIGAVFFK